MTRNIANEIKELHGKISDFITKEQKPPKDIGYTQGLIMIHLMKHRDEKIYQKDLERVLHIRKSSVTEHINTLEKKGMIERVCDEDDKRRRYLRPTRKSLNINKGVLKAVEIINDKMVKGIKKEEMDTFFSVLDKMKGNMDL